MQLRPLSRRLRKGEMKVGSEMDRTGIQAGKLAVRDWKRNHTGLEG